MSPLVEHAQGWVALSLTGPSVNLVNEFSSYSEPPCLSGLVSCRQRSGHHLCCPDTQDSMQCTLAAPAEHLEKLCDGKRCRHPDSSVCETRSSTWKMAFCLLQTSNGISLPVWSTLRVCPPSEHTCARKIRVFWGLRVHLAIIRCTITQYHASQQSRSQRTTQDETCSLLSRCQSSRRCSHRFDQSVYDIQVVEAVVL